MAWPHREGFSNHCIVIVLLILLHLLFFFFFFLGGGGGGCIMIICGHCWQTIFLNFKRIPSCLSCLKFRGTVLLLARLTMNWNLLKEVVDSDRQQALFQYPIRHLIVRSRKISKPQDLYFELADRLKFDRHLDSTAAAADVPVKFQSDVII